MRSAAPCVAVLAVFAALVGLSAAGAAQTPGAQAPAAVRPPASRLPAAQLAVSPGPPPQTPPPTAAARDTGTGRLFAPSMAGRPQAAITARDNDSAVVALERGLRCTCGCNLDVYTCRTTDFTCATSPAMHRVVLARLDSGMTAQQVVAAFQAQYGDVVLMAPPKRGFSWAAYVVPFLGLFAGLVIVGLILRRWFVTRPKQPLDGAEAEAATPAASDDEMQRLRQELERFEA
jgi:cytochrome c-type biogenesis protein CcmH